MAEQIRVEIAYAEADRQFLRAFELPAGSTVADALRVSGIYGEFAINPEAITFGIWSKPVSIDTEISDGDRVELYRPLKIDPMDARRKRAKNRSR